MGYVVAMEVARRPEGLEVNGDLRKTVSHRSLVPFFILRQHMYDLRQPLLLFSSSTTLLSKDWIGHGLNHAAALLA